MYRTDDLQELWVGLSCFLYQAEFFSLFALINYSFMIEYSH